MKAVQVGAFGAQVLASLPNEAQWAIVTDMAAGIAPPVPLSPRHTDVLRAHGEARHLDLLESGVDMYPERYRADTEAVFATLRGGVAAAALRESDGDDPPVPSPS